jgi:heme a synthase
MTHAGISQRPSLPNVVPGQLLRALPLLSSHLVVAVVALVVIGGATRVMEAGLACPDWPLCYGTLLPGRQMNLQVFLEWFHRLDAFLVGLALVAQVALCSRWAASLPRWLPTLSAAALLLVVFQGLLGALTVLQQLAAPTVTAHLATALLLLLLLSGLHQLIEAPGAPPAARVPLAWTLLWGVSLTLVFCQCILGAAMASQWAADLCLSAGQGCRWLAAHRLGAYPAAASVLLLAASAALTGPHRLRLLPLALAAAALVLLQLLLGVLTLRLQLAEPAVTIAHQLVAALLIALLGALGARCLTPSTSLRTAIAAPVFVLEKANG